jgi:hypothetical protein
MKYKYAFSLDYILFFSSNFNVFVTTLIFNVDYFLAGDKQKCYKKIFFSDTI